MLFYIERFSDVERLVGWLVCLSKWRYQDLVCVKHVLYH